MSKKRFKVETRHIPNGPTVHAIRDKNTDQIVTARFELDKAERVARELQDAADYPQETYGRIH